jgi:hypothetical protein
MLSAGTRGRRLRGVYHDPALGQQIVDVAETQGEPDLPPDRVLDDLGWMILGAGVDGCAGRPAGG